MITSAPARRFTGSKFMLMALCGIAAVSGSAARAATPAGGDDVPRLTVHYSSAMLESDEGVRTLYARLRRAAEQVCPAYRETRFITSSSVMQCREKALADAVRQVNNTRLAALHTARTRAG